MVNALYAGTFDPFTKGHYDVLWQAAMLFDTVYLVFADNEKKVRKYNVEDMMYAVRKSIWPELENVVVMKSPELVTDLARGPLSYQVSYFVRGVRDVKDYMYEEEMAQINQYLNPSVRTMYFRPGEAGERPPGRILSSTLVNELFIRGQDISQYVQKPVLEAMKRASEH